MKDGLNRRGFLGALGALTALVVATPLLARECAAPPEELVETFEGIDRSVDNRRLAGSGTAVDLTTCAEIYKKLYSKSVPAALARRRHPMYAAIGHA
jgi:hypothetical protein